MINGICTPSLASMILSKRASESPIFSFKMAEAYLSNCDDFNPNVMHINSDEIGCGDRIYSIPHATAGRTLKPVLQNNSPGSRLVKKGLKSLI